MTSPRIVNRLGGIALAFGDRNFRVYSVGSIASWASYFVQLIAVSWLTWELTEHTGWLAAIALCDLVPPILLTPLTGAIADRIDRHKIMIVTSALLGAQAAILAACHFSGVLTVWLLVVLVALHGTLIAFMVPAMYGTLPRFVDRKALSSAIAVSSSYTQLAVFLGPAFAGWLIDSRGVGAAFVVNAVGYAALLTAFLALKTPEYYQRPKPSGNSVVKDIFEGFGYIRTSELTIALFLISFAADALIGGFVHMLPAYSATLLGFGVFGMSTVLTARGGGAVLAALVIAYFGQAVISANRVVWASLVVILGVAALVAVPSILFVALVAMIIGMAGEIRRTVSMSLIQLTVPEEMRGRVMGNWFMMHELAGGLGAIILGLAARAWGLGLPTLVFAGIALFYLIFVARLFRQTIHPR